MRRLTAPLLIAAACVLSGCAYNADLGRDQLLIVNDEALLAMSPSVLSIRSTTFSVVGLVPP